MLRRVGSSIGGRFLVLPSSKLAATNKNSSKGAAAVSMATVGLRGGKLAEASLKASARPSSSG